MNKKQRGSGLSGAVGFSRRLFCPAINPGHRRLLFSIALIILAHFWRRSAKNQAFRFNLFAAGRQKGFPLQSFAPHGLSALRAI
jgi:hypothetical protein